MGRQIPVSSSARADEEVRDGLHEVTPDVAYQHEVVANVIFYGPRGAGDGQWVLIDAGVTGTAGRIAGAAEERFGKDARPAAILLTHGHFDHVGALEALAERWEVPIFAHTLETPYLNGTAAYPPPDPSVGGGMLAALSPLFPSGPIDVSRWLQTLPSDGSVPGMPGWQWIHTPGHTPGHVSFWRAADRTLLVGDAFVTTRQESAYAAITQQPEIHGPPMYFTQNWVQARASVEKLATLEPELVVAGHGPAMQGPEMRAGLQLLARDFDRIAVPEQSRSAKEPAWAEDGSAYREVS